MSYRSQTAGPTSPMMPRDAPSRRIFAARFSAKNGSAAGSKRTFARTPAASRRTPSRPSDARGPSSERTASTVRSSGSTSSGSGRAGRARRLRQEDFADLEERRFRDAVREVRALDRSAGPAAATRAAGSRRAGSCSGTASGSALRPGRDEARGRLVAEGVRHRLEESLAGQHPPREVGDALDAAHAPDHDRQRSALGNLVVAVDADDFLDQVNLAVHVHGAEGGARAR